MMQHGCCLLLSLSILFAAGSNASAAPAEKLYDLPKVVAVQDRSYFLNHDLNLQVGYLPSDAFNKGYTVGASYTHFFSDYLGWEVVNANYSFNSETRLKKDLLENFQAEVANVGFGGVLDYIQWWALTSLVYTPLYTKSLLFNKDVVRGETSFVFGAGGAQFKATGMRPLISAGLYLRFFTRPDRSWRFDFRNNVYFEDSLGAVNTVSLMVGYSMQLGGNKSKGASTSTESSNDL